MYKDSIVLIVLFFILGYLSIQRFVSNYDAITDNQIEKETYGKLKQIIYFSSPRCPHCSSFKPTWDRFVQQYKYNTFVKFREVGLGMNNENGLIDKWQIKQYPSILAIKNDKLYAEFEGPRTFRNLVSFLKMFSSDQRVLNDDQFQV